VIGVPLPLFAYGGSALVTTLIAVGLLMNVSLRRYVF
jgi:rod shape determining protein RodA